MKNKKIKIFYIIVLLLSMCNFFILFNTYNIKTTKITIKTAKVSNEINFVQISDLHGVSFDKNNQSLIKKIKKLEPDFILVTGDMYTKNDNNGKNIALKLFADLLTISSVYFVNGEHDNDKDYLKKLNNMGIKVLDYKIEIINVEQTTLFLYGIDNVYYSKTFSLKNAFLDVNPNYFNILLAHIPNFEAFVDFQIDLAVCGDSHGGQIRLPFIGSLKYKNIWFPYLKKIPIFDKGLYSKNKTLMYVSTGLGNYKVPIRMFNRPEVVFFRLINDN